MLEENKNINKGNDTEAGENVQPTAETKTPTKVIPGAQSKAPTSADVVADPSAKQRRKLETRIATLEDQITSLTATNSDYESKLALLAKTPSATNPEKSILEELDEWVSPILDFFNKARGGKKEGE